MLRIKMEKFNIIISVLLLFQVLLLRETFCNPVKIDEKLSADKIVVIREIGEKLKENINAEVNPCVDYYSYICSNYNVSTEELPKLLKFPRIKSFADFQSDFITMLTAKLYVKIDNLLPTCQESAEREFEQFIRIFNFADSIGGWPALDSNWKGDKFDLDAAIAEMNSFLIPVLINSTFVEEELTMKRYLSVKLVEETSLNNQSIKEQLLQTLLRSELNNAHQIVDQCSEFEKNYISRNSRSEEDMEHLIETDYRGLREVLPEIDWNKQFKIIFGRILNDTYPVVIRNPENIRNTFKIVSGMNSKSVANYFFCHFIKESIKAKNRLSDEYDCVDDAFLFPSMEILREFFDNSSYINNTLGQVEFAEILHSTEKALNKTFRTIVDTTSLDDIRREFNRNTILQNEFYLTREAVKHLAGYFIDKNEQKLKLAHIKLVQAVIFYSLFGRGLPSAISFKILTENIVSLTVLMSRESSDFDNSTRECFQHQIGSEKLENRHLFDALMTQINFRAFFDWANNHKEMIEAEDEILMEYGLTNKEFILEDYMRSSCGDQDNLASVYLQNVKEFSDVYNCPLGSPMNPVKKCELF